MADIALALFVIKVRQFGGIPRPQLRTLATIDRGSGPLAGVSYLPQRPIVEPQFRRSSSF
jgi:hypothetical protein